jgi:hypothetical protein
MAEIGRPPVLRIRHQRAEVRDHGIEIEALELIGVVERPAHGVGKVRVVMENLDIKLVRPPVTIRESAVERALAGVLVSLCVHFGPPIAYSDFFREPTIASDRR